MSLLTQISSRRAEKYRRQRSQLVDAMLDAHFHIGGKKIAIGAEPDLLAAVGKLLVGIGAELSAVVTTTAIAAAGKSAGDGSADRRSGGFGKSRPGLRLLITHSHGRQMAERLDIPFLRMGIPMFDRWARRISYPWVIADRAIWF